MGNANWLRPTACHAACDHLAAGSVLTYFFVMPFSIGDVQAEPIPFAPSEFHAAGDFPANVIIVDLNGDELPDISVNNSHSETGGVSVLFNTGNGSFGPPVRILSGIATRVMAAGDLDGDTDIDLAVNPTTGPLLLVLKNDGTGTFGPPVASDDSPFRPDRCHLRDLDGDEDLDIVMGLTGDAIAGVWMNPGDGTFDDPTLYMSDNFAYTTDLTVADFDGDLDLDLATVRTLNVDPPWLLRNQGDGTFSPPEVINPATFRYVKLASGDVDLDGDDDLALVTGNTNRMEVFRNDGTGTFLPSGSYTLGSSETLGESIVLTDLDGDTAPEAIIPFRNGVSVRVLRNDGVGHFAPPDQYSVAIEPTAVASGDLDADGDPDLALTALTSNGVSVLRNLSQSPASVPPSFSDRLGPRIVAMQPNPVREAATIVYRTVERGLVRLSLHDVSGRRVELILDDVEDAGDHALSWRGTVNGESLSAGRYILRLEAGGMTTFPVTVLR